MHRKSQPSPMPTKRSEEPSPKPKARPKTPKTSVCTKECLSSTRTDLETVDLNQMTPVCKIQCAMKKDLEVDDRESANSMSPMMLEDSGEKKKNSPERVHLKSVHKINSSKKDTDDANKYGECSKRDNSPRKVPSPAPARNREPVSERKERERTERERTKISMAPDRCEVTRLIKQLCSGDAGGAERLSGAKNAQLQYASGNSPRQPSTPQLLRILEETIQKKVPKPLFQKQPSARGLERHRLLFNISEKTSDSLFQYRTKFVQHMLTSAMYANSAVGKPWEMIGSISEQIIDELLLGCLKEMEVRDLVVQLYKTETR
ncbi:hypothetical protein B5X24_HaOG208682 [Helicoverpa armigera]|uniref:Uncharacterized protein n=1 Tax=Helicoverpa armigera TaxID=29058 RepID=A0A2W1BKS5_HELAM|nr:hypothetical protein B5X24_HaOG208682 [Helicoverpa armigera]